jgi:hypothetical protein
MILKTSETLFDLVAVWWQTQGLKRMAITDIRVKLSFKTLDPPEGAN